MKKVDFTIYDKIRTFILQNGNILTIRTLRDFIEEQFSNKAFLVETPNEIVTKGYYTFSYLDNFNMTITLYLDNSYKVENPCLDSKIKVLSIVCVIS